MDERDLRFFEFCHRELERTRSDVQSIYLQCSIGLTALIALVSANYFLTDISYLSMKPVPIAAHAMYGLHLLAHAFEFIAFWELFKALRPNSNYRTIKRLDGWLDLADFYSHQGIWRSSDPRLCDSVDPRIFRRLLERFASSQAAYRDLNDKRRRHFKSAVNWIFGILVSMGLAYFIQLYLKIGGS